MSVCVRGDSLTSGLLEDSKVPLSCWKREEPERGQSAGQIWLAGNPSSVLDRKRRPRSEPGVDAQRILTLGLARAGKGG